MAKELYVGNISAKATDDDIRRLFKVAGTVTSLHLITDPETGEFKGCGYVRMLTDAEAKDAIETLDGALLVDKVIHVSEARPQKPKGRSGGRGAPGKAGGYRGRGGKPAGPGRPEGFGRPASPGKSAGPAKPARPGKSAGVGKSAAPGRAPRPGKPASSGRPSPSGKPGKGRR